MSKYSQAKMVALGLKVSGDEMAVDAGRFGFVSQSNMGLQVEMPFQYFDKKLAPPSIVLAHKAALSMYSEYPEDRKHALSILQELSQACKTNQAQTIARILKKNPAAEWLSFVFLDPEELEIMLWEPILQVDDQCRKIVISALRGELARLRAFTDLLTNIIDRMSEKI